MKNIFRPGDTMVYKKKVSEADFATFHGETLHPVCSTFSLGRDFEWSSRLFFIEMKEDDEEGVGTLLTIEHKSPAFLNEEITFTATVENIRGNELICSIVAAVGDRVIATGTTGQKMLKKDKLRKIFSNPND